MLTHSFSLSSSLVLYWSVSFIAHVFIFIFVVYALSRIFQMLVVVVVVVVPRSSALVA